MSHWVRIIWKIRTERHLLLVLSCTMGPVNVNSVTFPASTSFNIHASEKTFLYPNKSSNRRKIRIKREARNRRTTKSDKHSALHRRESRAGIKEEQRLEIARTDPYAKSVRIALLDYELAIMFLRLLAFYA